MLGEVGAGGVLAVALPVAADPNPVEHVQQQHGEAGAGEEREALGPDPDGATKRHTTPASTSRAGMP